MVFVVSYNFNYRNSDVAKNNFKWFLDVVFGLMDGSKRVRCFSFKSMLKTCFRGMFFE